jgi:enamine deaminase RidA (YjgF/YER057c/UK114 family)
MMLPAVQSAKSRANADSQSHARPPRSPGVEGVATATAHGAEIFLTLKPLPGEGIIETFGRLAAALKELDATMVHLTVFGSVLAGAAGTEAMRRVFGGIDWPVTWVEGAACDDRPIAGMHAFAFAGSAVKRIVQDGRIVGSVFEDGTTRQCLLGGMVPRRMGSSRSAQTQETLQNIGKALAQAGFSFCDVVRTWFYLDHLLRWYDEFNQVRTRAYSQIQFRTGSLPASTGVSGRNPAGTALMAGVWAVQPLNSSVRIGEVASPLQCPAPAYGSSFSRAMEIASPKGRLLLISGTASIAGDGGILWRGDVRKQVASTFEVVEAILQSRGFAFSDITRATAYFKNRAQVRAFTEWCAARELRFLPVVTAQCGICRDELLFELEADAWQPNQAG